MKPSDAKKLAKLDAQLLELSGADLPFKVLVIKGCAIQEKIRRIKFGPLPARKALS